MTTTHTTHKTGSTEINDRARADRVVAETMLRDMAYVLQLTRQVRESIEKEAGIAIGPKPMAVTGQKFASKFLVG